MLILRSRVRFKILIPNTAELLHIFSYYENDKHGKPHGKQGTHQTFFVISFQDVYMKTILWSRYTNMTMIYPLKKRDILSLPKLFGIAKYSLYRLPRWLSYVLFSSVYKEARTARIWNIFGYACYDGNHSRRKMVYHGMILCTVSPLFDCPVLPKTRSVLPMQLG